MGSGIDLHCSNCGKDYNVWVGAGMAFPDVCSETLAAIKAGEYGQKLKKAAESETYVGVGAEQKIFVCEDCGHWDVFTDATVYGLVDIENGPAMPFGQKTIAEWGCIPYVATWADFGKFRVIEEYAPTCPKCGGAMRALPDHEKLPQLKCPECGGPLDGGETSIRWD